MAASSTVSAGDTILATQYNNLRTDVIDLTSGHDHDGSDSKSLPANTIAHTDTSGKTANDHHAQGHGHGTHSSIGIDDHHNETHGPDKHSGDFLQIHSWSGDGATTRNLTLASPLDSAEFGIIRNRDTGDIWILSLLLGGDSTAFDESADTFALDTVCKLGASPNTIQVGTGGLNSNRSGEDYAAIIWK
jgi:hypothetical protein